MNSCGNRDSGGIERAAGAEALVRTVLVRRFGLLREDREYEWDELWFRATVWNHRHACDLAGQWQPPFPPEEAEQDQRGYGNYLQLHEAEPFAVEVRTPRQVRDAVLNTPAARTGSGGTRAGAVSRSELDDIQREISHLITQAREAGWSSEATGEHRALRTARSKLADLDQELADRVADLEQQHSHRPGFTVDA
uniref:hypothetical protein n=1 Tax=Amycolatopsis sp. CA-096443 TaxID=3239919 RepID=UPI003F497C89